MKTGLAAAAEEYQRMIAAVAKKPRIFFQLPDGNVVPFRGEHNKGRLLSPLYRAWDRRLGAWVFYARNIVPLLLLMLLAPILMVRNDSSQYCTVYDGAFRLARLGPSEQIRLPSLPMQGNRTHKVVCGTFTRYTQRESFRNRFYTLVINMDTSVDLNLGTP